MEEAKGKKKNRQKKRIAMTLLLLIVWGSVLLIVTQLYYEAERTRCFQRLEDSVDRIGANLDGNVRRERQYLQTVAGILAQCDLEDHDTLQRVMKTASGAGMIMQLEILFPGDKTLGEEGEGTMPSHLSFEAEVSQGVHFTLQENDEKEEKKRILKGCIPIIQDGKTEGILCGTINMEYLIQNFTENDYGTSMQVYIIDIKTGDFLLDTWHSEAVNMEKLSDRNPAKGYTREQFIENFMLKRKGITIFKSQKAGENFYVSYAPIEEEDWMILVSVPESIAFAYAENIQGFFQILAGVLMISFALYFFWTWSDMKRENRESEQNVKNISYILDVEKDLFAAHMNPECFRNALKKIAEFTSAKEAFFWADTKKKEMEYWSSVEEHEEGDMPSQDGFPGLLRLLGEGKSFVSYELSAASDINVEERERLAKRGIRSLMIVPIRHVDGELIGILGAINMKKHWETAEPLEQIALSFVMTIEQYLSYRRLDQMGQMDTMTGLFNRNRFNAELEELEEKKMQSLSCIYIDANGLHNVNNRLGHQAGDEMLIRMAEVLKSCFSMDLVYRIGGDEFVILCKNRGRTEVYELAQRARRSIQSLGYEISVGIQHQEKEGSVASLVNAAEEAMRMDKQRFYAENGGKKQSRILDEKAVAMMRQKQDMDMFLSVLAPVFKGVYFVDLKQDAVRHIFIPSYFSEILKQENGSFQKGICRYARQLVAEAFSSQFEQFCQADHIEKKLMEEEIPGFKYQKLDGSWVQLYVMKVKRSEERYRETLWIFMDLNQSLDIGNVGKY